jgi:xanthine dehydrogenase small subunit
LNFFVRRELQLFINGKPVNVGDEDAFSSLADFLRQRCRLTGTKIVCNEGDCGACSVLLGRADESGRLKYQAIDACIAFLFQLDKTHIVTIEGLGTKEHLSPIQSAMVDCHGSQCGFCTPGFVVALHGIFESQAELSDEVMRQELSGNLCRCTGYASILAAAASVASGEFSTVEARFPSTAIAKRFAEAGNESVLIESGGRSIFIPSTIADATNWRAKNPQATIVVGATDYGVLRNHGKIDRSDILCLINVKDFSSVKIEHEQLSIGGGATWSAIEAFVQPHLPEYHSILQRFGSPQIRKLGTIGGNLASGSPIADAAPFHLAMNAEIVLVSQQGSRRLPLEEFYLGYRQTALRSDEMILSVETPLPRTDERLKLFKVSKRRDMDISTATFALWIKLEGNRIAQARIFMGGVGPMVVRLADAETILIGSTFSEAVFREAGLASQAAIQPWTDVRGGMAYRKKLAENLLLKSYIELSS